MLLTLRERRDGPPGGVAGAPGTAGAPEQAATSRRELRCAACGHPITSTDARVERAGSSGHTFVNPSGIVFRISCFAAAPGAAVVGPRSTEWTWFPGYAWQVQLCRGCHAHVGWRFSSADDRFSGLIDDRLVEAPDEA